VERLCLERANKSDVEEVTMGLDSITIDLPAAWLHSQLINVKTSSNVSLTLAFGFIQ